MKKILNFLLFIFILALILIIYARYIGTKGFITREYMIYDNIQSGYDGLKIVHFSDIHYNRAINIEKINRIVEEINLINPDIVVFTGDLVDMDVTLSSNDYNDLINSFNKINAKYGKYAVIGNHDYKSDVDKVIDVYNNSGFKCLDNDYDIIYNINGEKIFIGGIGNVSYDMDDISKTFSYFSDKEENDIYKIILVHEPDITDEILKDNDVDLILAGHSHNGQIRLPYLGAIYTPPYAKKYYDNHYKVNNTDLYISSGIGVSTINYRLFDKPSINFYRINKKEKN